MALYELRTDLLHVTEMAESMQRSKEDWLSGAPAGPS